MAFGIYSSNHLNILAHLLKTDIINANGAEVSLKQLLEKRLVLVQTRGMGTWLKYFLADACGICANVEFPFLQQFIDSQLNEHSLLKEKKILTLEEMRWLLFNEFQKNHVKYPDLQPYLQSENTPLKSFELALEMATMFDQYQAYIPQELRSWKNLKNPPPWQAQLYREVFSSFQTREEAHECFQKAPELHGNFCKTIVIFGMSAMSPLQMSFFKSLSTIVDVQLYYLNPSEHYWGSSSAKTTLFEEQMAYLNHCVNEPQLAEKQPEIGNPILSQCGKVGVDFLTHVAHGDFHFTVERGYFLSRDDSTRLRSVQSDIFMNEMGKRTLEMTDDSIRVHNCHTPRREIEVLHDEILGLIERSKGAIQPKDILVMSPAIEQYEPFIDAVFGFGALKYHYAIADRSARQSSVICKNLLLILNLISRDFRLSEVLDVFKSRSVRAKFGVDENSFEQLRIWLEKSGIRWGEDAKMHAEKTQCAFKTYSFESGLERLIMGLALHESVYDHIPYDLAPMAMIEGEQASVLGGFCLFLTHLFDFSKKIKNLTLLTEFKNEFLNLIDQVFIRDDETIDELLGVRNEVMNLGAHVEQTPFFLDVVKKSLTSAFDRTRETGLFLSGKITFCSMMPMRSIPMKVVTILGLNDSVFPRHERELTFNLLTKNSVFRDNSYCPTQQQTDRFLFLETLLSAQDHLLLFYCGQNPQKNELFPPSVVLGELIDYLEMRFDFHEIQHRLYAYNPTYFQGEGTLLNSYNEQAFKVCERMLENRAQTATSYRPNGVCVAYEKKVSLNDLIEALSHPLLFHLKKNTQVDFSTFNAINERVDEEVFALNALSASQCKRQMAKMSFGQSLSFEEISHQMALENQLAVGAQGVEEIKKLYEDVLKLPDRFKLAYKHEKSVKFEFIIEDIEFFGEITLAGEENAIFENCFAKIKSKTIIVLWIKHLVLCANGMAQESYLAEVSKDGVFEYQLESLSSEQAHHYLIELVQLFKRAHSQLVTFFPQTSLTYATSEKHTPEDRWKEAVKTYAVSFSFTPEKISDKTILNCFPEENEIDFSDLDACARCLLRPFFSPENAPLMKKVQLNGQ